MVAGSSSTGSGVGGAAETRPKEILLFGVRVVVDNMRKIVSLNNMNDYEHLNDNEEDEEAAAGASASAAVSGYMSADDIVQHSSSASERRSQRKRGLPWTEEEHKRFLVGLQKMGKGDWRGISRNFVKTRTPTQVASHAQKHFLRNSNGNRRRRRSSLFDITTDMVTETPMEEQQAQCKDSKSNNQAPKSNPPLQANSTTSFPGVLPFPVRRRTVSPAVSPLQIESSIMENRPLGQGNQSLNYSTNPVLTVPVVPAPCTSAMPDLNLNLKPVADSSPLSLDLSSSSDQRASSSRHSAFQTMSSLKNGDKTIVVA